MMDDWSLKDKKVKQNVADDGDGYIDVWDDYSERGKYYSLDDIEILREKLIEDAKKLSRDYPVGIVEALYVIINKRFGVWE